MFARSTFLLAFAAAAVAMVSWPLVSAHAQDAARASKPLPSLKKAPTLDGKLKELKPGYTLSPTEGDAFTAKAAYRQDTLYLGLTAADDRLTPGDIVEVTMFFPGAGTTARGYTWRFGIDGLRSSDELPAYAQSATKAVVEKTDEGLVLEAAFPARALPRFPAKEPLVFDLCVLFEDRDAPAETPKRSSNCEQGTMKGPALKLGEDFRKALKLKPPENVVGIEGRADGWVGYAVLHYPVWVASEVPLTAQVLRNLVAEQVVEPKKAGINLPDALLLPDGRTVLSVVSGKDPYEVEGKCDADRELRLGLYLVIGRTAERVLDWPASTCALGRAVAVELDEEGELTMGYTNGATVTFLWSKDHFERTEIGSR